MTAKGKRTKRERIVLKPPRPAFAPLQLTVDLTAEQHASLVQIHSIVNRTGKDWPLEDVLTACIAFAAHHLSLAIPATAVSTQGEEP